MPNTTKEVKRKIKSINSTGQITKAMELVSTSKMKKAVNQAVNLRAYGYLAFNILSKLSKKHSKLHKFFQTREVNSILMVFFTTDKGLCGGLNANLCKKIVTTLTKLEKDYPKAKIHFIAVGKKGAEFLRRLGKTVEMFFPAYSSNPKLSDVAAVANVATKGFLSDEYDKVVAVYPDFVSTLVQKAVSKTLLPFSMDTFKEMIDELGTKFMRVVLREGGKTEQKPGMSTEYKVHGHVFKEKDLEYKLEPSTEYIIDNIVPQLAKSQLFQAVLEAAASEHSARMVAMQNANKAAKDLLDDLVLTYNQARQAAITAEIAEIASAATSQA